MRKGHELSLSKLTLSSLGYEFEDAYVQEVEEPPKLTLEHQKKKDRKDQGNLPGFRVASTSDYKMERLVRQFKIISYVVSCLIFLIAVINSNAWCLWPSFLFFILYYMFDF